MTAIVVLTGAGISAESGIQTFRGGDGLWEKHRIEDVATPEGFARNPELVQGFYNARRQQLSATGIDCNAAHTALANFERQWLGDFLLVTQNVDDLHERAGSQNVLHMHGELLKVRCQHCGCSVRQRGDVTAQSQCPECQSENTLRPDIVWFGEVPYGLQEIEEAVRRCDIFVSIGTSGQVYPAAGFSALAQEVGATTVEINVEKTASQFDQGYYGLASMEVPAYFEGLLA